MDLVKCNNCMIVMVVRVGTDKCPICNKKGDLAWVDPKYPEVKVVEENE